jgi:hypothetical protein
MNQAKRNVPLHAHELLDRSAKYDAKPEAVHADLWQAHASQLEAYT